MLEQINNMTADEFVAAYGGIFEHSPWVASRAWHHRPFHTLNHLRAALDREVQKATYDEQLTLIRAHPDLGTRAKVSTESANEQAGAGLDRLTMEEYQALQELNTSYMETFGFPFILAVKGSDKAEIIAALERRLHSSPKDEFAEALRQIYLIARNRLEQKQ